LDGNRVASGVIASGQYRVTVPLPPDVSQATVVVTANFVAGGVAQARKHKTVAVVRVNATQQADINPTTTLATAALEQAPNTVPPDLDINAFVQAQQNLQIDLTQVDFSSDDKIQQALPVMLVVTSNPSGAQVLINGQPQQQASTPFFLRSGLQGGDNLTVQVRRQATIGNETITTTLGKSVTLKVRGSTPVHFDFTPQIVSAQVANGALNLQVKNAGSANEKVIVRFGDTQAVVATIASVDEQGVATISVTIPQGVSGQVQVRVQNAARTSAAQNVSI
jgi:HSP20 family molecular chaperone IbpA